MLPIHELETQQVTAMNRISAYWLAFTTITYAATASAAVEIDDLSWLEQWQTDKQVEVINDLGRAKLGQPVRGNKDDLELIQRIIDRGLIAKDSIEQQQALGAVLGNLMAQEFNLQWKSYEDSHGRSRAICIPNTEQCLFPITMLSRRMQVGLLPRVERIYTETESMITQYRKNKGLGNPYDQ